jgi:hypothetical protein
MIVRLFGILVYVMNFGLVSRLSSLSLILDFTITKGSKYHSCVQSK